SDSGRLEFCRPERRWCGSGRWRQYPRPAHQTRRPQLAGKCPPMGEIRVSSNAVSLGCWRPRSIDVPSPRTYFSNVADNAEIVTRRPPLRGLFYVVVVATVVAPASTAAAAAFRLV